MTCATRSYCEAKKVISKMMVRTALRRVPSPSHLEPQLPLRVPVEKEECFEPLIIRLGGSSTRASLGATRKARAR